IFTKYKQILEKKNEFNINIEKFLNKIKKDLINILKSKGLEKYEELIDSPLRFYLVKMNNCINTEEGYVDHILENERAYLKQGSIENKTFQISKKQLISLMKTNKVDDIESIKKLKENVEELDKLILEFQNYLKLVTSAKILGLTSSCIIEKKLSNKNRLRSLFHRKKPRSQ
ncbi:MAG: hypothetical protein L0H53_02445, partial [Candidatus Nitrosocosmicus sp.]|nr:hypothetical protein [Candidatus Nitrosocosmicus sp.]